MAQGDKPYLRKSTDRKAQIRKVFIQFSELICALRSVDFLRKGLSPRATSRTISFSISNSFWYIWSAHKNYTESAKKFHSYKRTFVALFQPPPPPPPGTGLNLSLRPPEERDHLKVKDMHFQSDVVHSKLKQTWQLRPPDNEDHFFPVPLVVTIHRFDWR